MPAELIGEVVAEILCVGADAAIETDKKNNGCGCLIALLSLIAISILVYFIFFNH